MANFLNYTNLTYEEILQGVKNKVSSDPRFENFNESALAQEVYEIFAGATDMVNYYIERRAEENYFATCKLRSSAILLAKQLGYVITRPVPATANIKVKITGDLTGKNIQEDDVLQIPIYSNFTYDSNNYLLKNTITYTFTSADINSISADVADYEKIITSGDDGEVISVLQGVREYRVIEGATNGQVNQNFQIYKIEDEDFSNRYGNEDYMIPITTVGVGKTSATAVNYNIDRRSLINLESIENFVVGDTKNVCVIRTANDENVELMFGDAQYAALGATVSANGPSTSYDNIYINYLSTGGSKVNKVGNIDEKLTSDVSVDVDGNDITSNVEFLFNSNIIGGADMEDINSIKLNAPSIYYSLDRLVSKRDYIAYLKSLTSPINIQNAIVWGEQDEMTLSDNDPIKKLFNVVLFCCLGSLYNLTGNIYSPKTDTNGLDTAVLDLDYSENELKCQNYFNVYVNQNVAQQLLRYETSGTYYLLYGDSDLGMDVDNVKILYDNDRMSVRYTSELYLSGDGGAIYAAYTSAISISAATDESDIASYIQMGLRGITDRRGTAAINANYGNIAFENLLCEYDSVNDRFVLSGHPNDSCYISEVNSSPMLNDLTSACGLYNKSSNKVTTTLYDSGNLMSTKITDVVDLLDVRSQVTLKDVYVSPLIQNFNLNGSIYVNRLADKNNLHTQIKNAIYTWLNTNADFNKNVYLSNIIEIIEGFVNVSYANVVLGAETIVTTPFNASTNSILNDALYSDETDLVTDFQTYYNTLSANSDLTERIFSEETKSLYDILSNDATVHTPFRDTQDFITVVSDIHKDMLNTIRTNIIDSNGNISQYTIGTEVPKIIVNTNIIYQT